MFEGWPKSVAHGNFDWPKSGALQSAVDDSYVI